MTESEQLIENAAYSLFRMMGNWMSRQCYEVNPTYTREQLLADLRTNLREFGESYGATAAASAAPTCGTAASR